MTVVLISEVASLIGDPSRASILVALLDGRAMSSKELAAAAHIAPQTASGHLARLAAANLLVQEKQGRHRYFRLATEDVARLLESLLSVASMTVPSRYRPTSRADESLRLARTCYDHLAGWVGVSLSDSLVKRNCIMLDADGGEVTPIGSQFLEELGVDLGSVKSSRRCFCRPCLDWTERRYHLAGAVGALLAKRLFELGWFKRMHRDRSLQITSSGFVGLQEIFGIDIEDRAMSRQSVGSAPRPAV